MNYFSFVRFVTHFNWKFPMKLLVKSTGPHYYQDPQTGDSMEHNRPSVVRKSEFVMTLIGSGKLALISAEVADTATDADFVAFYNDSDKKEDLAVTAFLSKHTFTPEAEAETETKATKTKAK